MCALPAAGQQLQEAEGRPLASIDSPSAPAEAPGRIRITVRFMDCSEAEVEVLPSDRVHVAKSLISAMRGITDARVKLMFGSSVLKINDRIAACGITDGAVVNAVILPPLYQGSQVYEAVADTVARMTDKEKGDDEVHDLIASMMTKKTDLHDALAARGRLLALAARAETAVESVS